MKKLEKLSINPEKMIKNEELVNLRGGYDWGYYKCCWDDQPTNCSTCTYTNTGVQCVDGAHLVKC